VGWRDTIAKKLAGIKAYHSSPHDFDKFDLKKIGTGEGAQVYGHGLYFAENPAVSGQGGQYWNQFLDRFDLPNQGAARRLEEANFSRDAAIRASQQHIDTALAAKLRGEPDAAKYLQDLRAEHQLLTGGQPVGPRTYEVNIKADPAQMLDWDKPLTQYEGQLDPVLRGLRLPKTQDLNFNSVPELLETFADKGKAAHLSAALNEGGIPGIRYLDEGSRISSPGQIDLIRQNIAQREALLAKNPGNPTDTKWLAEYQDMLKRAENPTSNYVVFDPANIDILKKYGVVGAPAGALAMGALADQSQYEVQP
jgi:hypothetical protein